MTYRYEFTQLLVDDFKACFQFYRGVLGFQVGFGAEDDTYADFNSGAVNISLFDKQEMSQVLGTSYLPAQSGAQDRVCLVFAVEDVAAVCTALSLGEGVWLIIYKKAAGMPRMEYDEAVEEALCFGWVDSKPNKLDDERSLLWLAPRKPGTGWSKPNKERVARLMAPASLAKVEAAQADGS